MQWDGLTVISGSGATNRNGYVKRVAKAKHGTDFFSGHWLNRHVGVFAVEKRSKDGRVPVEVAREALDDGGLRYDAGRVAEHFGQLRCELQSVASFQNCLLNR